MIRGAWPGPPIRRQEAEIDLASTSFSPAGRMPAMRMLSCLFALLCLSPHPRSAGSIGAAIAVGRGFRRSTRSRRPMSAISCGRGSFAPAISIARPPAAMARTKFEATPLFVEDSLIFCSPFNEVIALDPGTGAQKWRYDPKISTAQRPANRYNLPRRRLLGRRPGRRRRRLPRAHFHGHQRCPRDRARCQDRHSLRRFRRQGRGQARHRHDAGVAGRIPDHLARRW